MLRALSTRRDWRARRRHWRRCGQYCEPPRASCELLQSHRKEALVGLAISHRTSGIAPALRAAIERHTFVIGPRMLLRREHLECLVLRLPNLVDVEDNLRPEI